MFCFICYWASCRGKESKLGPKRRNTRKSVKRSALFPLKSCVVMPQLNFARFFGIVGLSNSRKPLITDIFADCLSSSLHDIILSWIMTLNGNNALLIRLSHLQPLHLRTLLLLQLLFRLLLLVLLLLLLLLCRGVILTDVYCPTLFCQRKRKRLEKDAFSHCRKQDNLCL